MADSVINTLSICSGVGMLDVGVHAGLEHLGIKSRTTAYAEWDAYAASQLVALMEAGCLDAAPVWCGDLGRIDGQSLRGRVDAVIGGFPCQPHSVAGKREGTNDERWIWPAIVDLIRDTGAWLVVLENVRGLLSSGGMGPVLADLSGIGFDAEWTVLSAGEVGASHRRERVFIVGVAHGQSGKFRELRESSGRDGQSDGDHAQLDDTERQRRNGQAVHAGRRRPEQAATVVDGNGACGTLADTGHQPGRPAQHEPRPCGCKADDCDCGEGMGDAAEPGRQGCASGRIQRSELAEGCQPVAYTECAASLKRSDVDMQRRWAGEAKQVGMGDSGMAHPRCERRQLPAERRQPAVEIVGANVAEVFAPGPSDPSWPNILRNQPWLAPATKSGLCSVVDGVALVVDESRRDQLRCVGNGVVPLQAAAAIVGLVRRLMA